VWSSFLVEREAGSERGKDALCSNKRRTRAMTLLLPPDLTLLEAAINDCPVERVPASAKSG